MGGLLIAVAPPGPVPLRQLLGVVLHRLLVLLNDLEDRLKAFGIDPAETSVGDAADLGSSKSPHCDEPLLDLLGEFHSSCLRVDNYDYVK